MQRSGLFALACAWTLGAALWALGSAVAETGAGAAASALPDGREIAERINARDDGQSRSQRLTMELIDRHSKKRVRETRSYRREFPDQRRTVLFFDSPKNVRGTGFLTYDYQEAGRDDDQWLFLPALRRVRRVSAADRGSYFMGTDFSYEDIKNDTRVSIDDYRWRTLGMEEVDGHGCYRLESIPADEATRDELGYGRVVSWVDTDLWMIRRAKMWDVNGNPLKDIDFFEIRPVQGIWTAHRVAARNHKTGHRTIFTISDVDYSAEVGQDLFTQQALARGK